MLLALRYGPSGYWTLARPKNQGNDKTASRLAQSTVSDSFSCSRTQATNFKRRGSRMKNMTGIKRTLAAILDALRDTREQQAQRFLTGYHHLNASSERCATSLPMSP